MNLLILIFLFPLISTLLAGLFGRFLGFRGDRLITILRAVLIISTIFSLIVFFEVALSDSHCTLSLSTWFYSEMVNDSWGIYFNTLVVMLFGIRLMITWIYVVFILLLSPYVARQDASEAWEMGFQDPATPLIPEIWVPGIWELDVEILLLLFALLYICWIIFFLIPSYAYGMRKAKEEDPAQFELKITGCRHVWHYVYTTPEGEIFAEFENLPRDIWHFNLSEEQLDCIVERVVLPSNTPIKLSITAEDVFHTWAVEGLNITAPAVPGSLFERKVTILREGVYYGGCFSCSFDPTFTRALRAPTREQLGRGLGLTCRRRFHPIIVEVVSLNQYTNWLIDRKQKLKRLPKGGPKPDRSTAPSGATKTPLEP